MRCVSIAFWLAMRFTFRPVLLRARHRHNERTLICQNNKFKFPPTKHDMDIRSCWYSFFISKSGITEIQTIIAKTSIQGGDNPIVISGNSIEWSSSYTRNRLVIHVQGLKTTAAAGRMTFMLHVCPSKITLVERLLPRHTKVVIMVASSHNAQHYESMTSGVLCEALNRGPLYRCFTG